MPGSMSFSESFSDVLVGGAAASANRFDRKWRRGELAIYEFHRDEVRATALAYFVDVSDVRMIERGRGLRFCV